MAQVVGINEGGATIWRRDDGTFYQTDPFGIGQTECIGPGQDPSSATRYPSIALGESFLNSRPLPCDLFFETNDPRVGEAYFETEINPLLRVLGSADPGLGPLPGVSPTAEALTAIANAPLRGMVSYEELLAGTAPPGQIGLVNLLRVTQELGVNDEITAQIDRETTAFRNAFRPIAESAIRKIKANVGGATPAEQLAGFAQILTDPGAFALNTAKTVGLGLLAPSAPARYQVDQVGAFFNYEDALLRRSAPEFLAFQAAYREKQMGILDQLGIGTFQPTGFDLPYLPPITGINGPVTFPLSFDPYGENPNTNPNVPYPSETGAPVFDTTGGGGIFDTITDVFGGILQTAARPDVLLPALQILSRRGIVRGSVGELFGGAAPVGSSPGISPYSGNMSTTGLGASMPTAGDYIAQFLGALNAAPDQQPVLVPPGMMASGAALAGYQRGCGSSIGHVNMMTAPGAYRLGCNGYTAVRKLIVDNADGSQSVFYNAGKCTIGSNEHSLAKRIAKRHGMKLTRRGGFR